MGAERQKAVRALNYLFEVFFIARRGTVVDRDLLGALGEGP